MGNFGQAADAPNVSADPQEHRVKIKMPKVIELKLSCSIRMNVLINNTVEADKEISKV